MKKILIVTDVFLGGVETFIENFVAACKKKDIKIDLVCFTPPNDEREIRKINFLKKNFDYLSIIHKKLLCHRLLFKLPQITLELFVLLRRVLSKKNVDAILVNLTLSSIGVIVYKKIFRLKIPIILQFHGAWSMEKLSEEMYYLIHYRKKEKGFKRRLSFLGIRIKFFIRKRLDLFAYRGVDRIVVFSNYSKNLLIENFGISSKKIELIKPGLSLPLASKILNIKKGEFKKKLLIAPNSYLILVLSRIEPRKGVRELLEAIKILKEKRNKFLVIVCSFLKDFDVYAQDLFRSVANLELGIKVLFVNDPPPEEKKLLLKAADVLVLPSRELETFGFVTLEAFSSATPVIAFDIGANSELIDGTNGILVKDVNSLAMAKKLIEYFSFSRKKKEKMRKACIVTAQKYSWRNYLYSFLKII